MAEITAALVKELREKSGVGMMDCKKALAETDGDMEAALDWLRAKGLSKAAKKADRVAAEGLIAIAARRDGKGQTAALITHPSLLLLDEAFSSLDTHLRRHLRTLTAERIRSQNIPAILVTHSAEEACTMADTIAIMHEGRILQHGTPETLIRRPVNAQAALLLGLANTGDTRYIPQHAIRFDPNGTSVRISEAVPLAEGIRLTLAHPQYGDLIWYPHADHDTDKPQTGQEILISVDENQIVWFDRI